MRYSIILLLSLYCIGFIKPVQPLIIDALAHTFNEIQHLATVHHKHGHDHVHHEIEEAEEHDTGEQTILNSESMTDHLVNKNELFTCLSFESLAIHNFEYLFKLTDVKLSLLHPPPEFKI